MYSLDRRNVEGKAQAVVLLGAPGAGRPALEALTYGHLIWLMEESIHLVRCRT